MTIIYYLLKMVMFILYYLYSNTSLIDKAIDWTFIYDLVEEKYCLDNGRPSMDLVMLIKIPFMELKV